MKKTQQKKIYANVTTLLMQGSQSCRKLFKIQNLISNLPEFIKKKPLKTNIMMIILCDDILSLIYLSCDMDKKRFHPKLCLLDGT